MGFFDTVNSWFSALGDTIGGGSLSYDYKCSQCIKCKQCIKNLSNGEQIRIFTCPATGNYDDASYIDEFFSGIEDPTKMSPEYIEKFQQNRGVIDDYINMKSVIYLDSAKPLCDYYNHVITTLRALQENRAAVTCPYFRPYVDFQGVLNDPPALIERCYPDFDEYRMSELSKEDKYTVTQDSEYPY